MKLAVVGAGGHAHVVADAALETGFWTDVVFFDELYPEVQSAVRFAVNGRFEDLLSSLHHYDGVFVAVGNSAVRVKLYQKLALLDAPIVSIFHPSAIVSRYAVIGSGVIVSANAVIGIGAEIGDYSIINTAATVDHDCKLGIGCHISPGANLAGGVFLGRNSWIGIGASIIQGIKIGDDVIVGAGAAVVSDISDNQTVVGVPARSIS